MRLPSRAPARAAAAVLHAALLFTAVSFAAQNAAAQTSLQGSVTAPATVPGGPTTTGVAFDRQVTAVAQVLAGITPAPGDPNIDRIVATDAWKEHQVAMQRAWSAVSARRVAMARWRDAEIQLPPSARRTLLYPFSGPDFLNAQAMFPDQERYVFLSLERPGQMPALAQLSPKQLDALFEDVRGALADIFQRNFFITDYMTKQLATPRLQGITPLVATMMALSGHRIVGITPLDPYPDLTRAYSAAPSEFSGPRPRRRMRAVRIEFVREDRASPQELVFFSVDASDKELRYYPEFANWVGQHKGAALFLKSASYLFHDQQFSQLRASVMSAADIIVQDDTGVPYRLLREQGWQLKLYGSYAKPIPALRYGHQADLESLYQSQANVPALPFPFGYRAQDGRSILFIATRPRV
jgi:hypothetical protein